MTTTYGIPEYKYSAKVVIFVHEVFKLDLSSSLHSISCKLTCLRVILFYKGLEVPTRQILDSKGVIPSMKAAEAKKAIQEVADHSQKCHNGMSTRCRSTETSNGLAAIQAQLNNLGREIKKKSRSLDQGFGNPNRVNKQEEGLYELKDFDAYSIGTTLLDDTLATKEKDHGSFTLPCIINNLCFNKALADLGASVSVMPFLTYTKLGLGELAPTKLIIELADRTMKRPKGIVENVLVGIDIFFFHVDFFVLDMPEDIKTPLILGRPLLSTAHAKIDVFKRKITLRVGSEKVVFKILKNIDAYRDVGMGDIIVGRPFCRKARVKARRFDGMITIYKGNIVKVDTPYSTGEYAISIIRPEQFGAGDLQMLKLDLKSANNGHVHDTDIIIVDQGCCEKRGMELMKKVANPRCLSYNIRNPAVFNLSTRTRHVSWCLEDHVRRLSQRKTQYPEVDQRVADKPAQSASDHIERTMLTFGVRGTSTQVLLSMRALYLSHTACFQLGSRREWNGDLRIGEEVVTCKLYLRLAFTVLTLERVTTGCCEVGGGGGGEVIGGVGVVYGDGVDIGVGGVVLRRSAMGKVSRLSSKNERIREGTTEMRYIRSGSILAVIPCKANLAKTKDIAKMRSPHTYGQMLSLLGKLSALNCFLARSSEKSIPFFETLKSITKENKDDYRWTEEAQKVFQQFNKMIVDLPSLTMLKPKENMYIYLATVQEAVGAVLHAERKWK
nr:hypothetical protein [Tanacetum cinerariifolium]